MWRYKPQNYTGVTSHSSTSGVHIRQYHAEKAEREWEEEGRGGRGDWEQRRKEGAMFTRQSEQGEEEKGKGRMRIKCR